MKCIAIDDEPMALSIIKAYCERREGMSVECFSDPLLGLEAVHRSRPNLLFLDIEMGGISGLDIARKLPQGQLVVFSTAYAKFALDGFDLGVVDFLHKPFSFPRFERAVERAEELWRNMQERKKNEQGTSREQTITLKVEYQNVKIPLENIIYVEAMDNYVKIFRSDSARATLSQISLKAFEEQVPRSDFMRVHRSYIVARGWIDSYNRSQILLRGSSAEIPVGRVYADNFISWASNETI